MASGNSIGGSMEFQAFDKHRDSTEETVLVNDDDEEDVETMEGVDFTKFVDVEYLSLADIERIDAEARAKESPVDYRYIDQMKREGVTEELAVKAFVGRFFGNEVRTRFFLKSDFFMEVMLRRRLTGSGKL